MFGEEVHPVADQVRRRVVAADQQQVAEAEDLVRAERLTAVAPDVEQRRDQVVAGLGPARLDQRAEHGVGALDRRRVALRPLDAHHGVGDPAALGEQLVGNADQLAHHQRWEWTGERLDQVARAIRGEVVDQGAGDLAEPLFELDDAARRERSGEVAAPVAVQRRIHVIDDRAQDAGLGGDRRVGAPVERRRAHVLEAAERDEPSRRVGVHGRLVAQPPGDALAVVPVVLRQWIEPRHPAILYNCLSRRRSGARWPFSPTTLLHG